MPVDALRLRHDREHVRQSISDRIQLGNEMLREASAIRTDESLRDHEDRFRTWNEYNRTLLVRCLSGPVEREYDPRTTVGLTWGSHALQDMVRGHQSRIRKRLRELDSLLQRLDLFEYEDGRESEGSSELDLDPGLWEHVRSSVDNEDWLQAAASAATFVESQVRKWASLGPDTYGKVLMSKALTPDGSPLMLGETTGEREGWHLLGMGFVAALGNVDRHRIQDRPDAKRYALGVIYTASLILTQIRRQHSDRTGPA